MAAALYRLSCLCRSSASLAPSVEARGIHKGEPDDSRLLGVYEHLNGHARQNSPKELLPRQQTRQAQLGGRACAMGCYSQGCLPSAVLLWLLPYSLTWPKGILQSLGRMHLRAEAVGNAEVPASKDGVTPLSALTAPERNVGCGSVDTENYRNKELVGHYDTP